MSCTESSFRFSLVASADPQIGINLGDGDSDSEGSASNSETNDGDGFIVIAWDKVWGGIKVVEVG